MTVLIKHILQTVRDRGNDSAFFYFESSEEKTLTCSQFRGLIFSCAAAIRSFSIAPGSRAILVGENSPAWPAAYLAAHLCGLTVAHGDSRFSEDEFKNIERFTKPALILCGRAFSNMFGSDVPKILLEDLAPALAEEEPEIIPLAPGPAHVNYLYLGNYERPQGRHAQRGKLPLEPCDACVHATALSPAATGCWPCFRCTMCTRLPARCWRPCTSGRPSSIRAH